MNLIPWLTAVSLVLHVQYKEISKHTNKTYIDIASCSAVLVSPTEALTAAHCLEGTTGHMWIKDSEGKSYSVYVEKKDIITDLCLLKIDGPAHKDYALLGKPVNKGDHIYVMDNGADIPYTYGEGVVANIAKDPITNTLSVLHTAFILQGASGSGVFDSRGYLVGINGQVIKSLSIAVDVEEIQTFMTGQIRS